MMLLRRNTCTVSKCALHVSPSCAKHGMFVSYFVQLAAICRGFWAFIKLKTHWRYKGLLWCQLNLELYYANSIKIAINAVTLALCCFDVSVAVFCVYPVWVICFVLVSSRTAVGRFRFAILLYFAYVNVCINKASAKPPWQSCVAHYINAF